MSAEPFVDTNIRVYAHTEEPQDLRGPRANLIQRIRVVDSNYEYCLAALSPTTRDT